MSGNLRMDAADAALFGYINGGMTGGALSGGTDLTGDDVPDLLFGGNNAHQIYIVDGAVSGTHSLEDADAILSATYVGDPIATGGDVNGDGAGDLLAGLPTNYGHAWLIHGPITYSGTIGSGMGVSFTYDAENDGFGNALACAGDVDGDGLDDVLIGAPYDDSLASNNGVAYLYTGSPGGSLSTADATARLYGAGAGDGAGACVQLPGDLNADGFGDVVVGATGDDAGDTDAGAVYLVFGPVTGTLSLADADARLAGEAADDRIYLGVAGGDLDADGQPDLLIGSDYPTDVAAYIFLSARF